MTAKLTPAQEFRKFVSDNRYKSGSVVRYFWGRAVVIGPTSVHPVHPDLPLSLFLSRILAQEVKLSKSLRRRFVAAIREARAVEEQE